MDHAFAIHKASHFFKVCDMSRTASVAVLDFARNFIHYGMVRQPGGRYTREALKVFAASNKTRTEYRFHINSLNAFMTHMEAKGFNRTHIPIEEYPLNTGTDAGYILKPEWKLYDYQEPIVEYINKPDGGRSKFVGLATGQGKTLTSLVALSRLDKITVAVIRPMYLEKWVSDIMKIYDCPLEDIIVAQGSKQLMALLLLAKENRLNAKFILISNKTMQNWIKMYEAFGVESLDLGYACYPDEMYQLLGAGVRLIDEVHQDFHFNFRQDLYTNVDKAVSLSATLLNNDPFIEKMYDIAYPRLQRYNAPAPPKYNNVASLITT